MGKLTQITGRGALFIVAIVAAVVGCQPTGLLAASHTPASLGSACQLLGSAEKGGVTLTFHWRLAVREDRPDGSAALWVSGQDHLLCQAWRGADGGFGVATSSIGRFDPVVGSPLTVDTGQTSGSGRWLVVVGRTPRGTATVELTATDGTREMARLGDGFYLARLTSAGQPTNIVARDRTGTELGSIGDPNGIQTPAVAGRAASP